MRFDLVRPCGNCPFRNDGPRYHFHPQRAREILDSVLRRDSTFACHKTLAYAENGDPAATENSQHCAGLLILDRKISGTGSASLPVRFAIMAGWFDPMRLDMSSPVVDTEEEFMRLQSRDLKSREGE